MNRAIDTTDEVTLQRRIADTELHLAGLRAQLEGMRTAREARERLVAGRAPDRAPEPFEEGADFARSLIESQEVPDIDHADQRDPLNDGAADPVLIRCCLCNEPATVRVTTEREITAVACRRCAPQLAEGTTTVTDLES